MEQEKSGDDVSEQQMSQMKERLNELNRKIRTLEWDKDHNQLNFGMEGKYSELKEERIKLTERINGI